MVKQYPLGGYVQHYTLRETIFSLTELFRLQTLRRTQSFCNTKHLTYGCYKALKGHSSITEVTGTRLNITMKRRCHCPSIQRLTHESRKFCLQYFQHASTFSYVDRHDSLVLPGCHYAKILCWRDLKLQLRHLTSRWYRGSSVKRKA